MNGKTVCLTLPRPPGDGRDAVVATCERVGAIIEACGVLARHPLIGRRRRDDKRELLIGSGAKGYVALYRYVLENDLVVILAIRAQRENGFAQER